MSRSKSRKIKLKNKSRVNFALISLTFLDDIAIVYFLYMPISFFLSLDTFQKMTVMGKPYWLAVLLAGVIVVFPIIAVWLLHLLLVSTRYGDPFNKINVHRLNTAGLLILIPWLLTSGWWGFIKQFWERHQEFNFYISNLSLSLALFGLAGVLARGVQLREEQALTV